MFYFFKVNYFCWVLLKFKVWEKKIIFWCFGVWGGRMKVGEWRYFLKYRGGREVDIISSIWFGFFCLFVFYFIFLSREKNLKVSFLLCFEFELINTGYRKIEMVRLFDEVFGVFLYFFTFGVILNKIVWEVVVWFIIYISLIKVRVKSNRCEI